MTEHDKHDMEAAASVFLRDLLGLKNGQRILFYTDQGSDPDIARIVHAKAEDIGAKSKVFELNSALSLTHMAQNLTDQIAQGSYDLICELSEQYFYQTSAWQKGLQGGARLYSIGGLNADGFIRCIGKSNHDLMYDFGVTLRGMVGKSKSVRILTQKGTDIRLDMNISIVDRVVSKLTGRKRPYAYVTPPSGKLSHKVPATFLGGQLAFNGILETIEGTAVIDGYLWPPREIGHVDEPISLKISKGKVIEVSGNSPKSRIFSGWLYGKRNEIQHFCIGFHPGAKLSGSLVEAERAFGCISIGIGEYPFHTDGVITNPTLLLNKKTIEKDGAFIHKDLAALQKRLIVDEHRT